MSKPASKNERDVQAIQSLVNAREGIVDFQEIVGLFNVAPQTVRNKVKLAMTKDKSLRGRVAGVFPEAVTIIDEVESLIGSVQGHNLVAANQKCRALMEAWSSAFADHFCQKALGSRLNKKTSQVVISFDELRDQLLVPYQSYLTQSANGLVSIAGTLNQSLLIRALRNSGLTDTGNAPQFRETGRKSEGDIQMYFNGTKGRRTLSVEAKSYAARERLLRGLADIPIPKVGVGFFTDASEFGKDRVTLMATSAHTSALYMPDETLNDLTKAARSVMHPETGRICRSLEKEFIDDMKEFVQNGLIGTREAF